MCYNNLLKFENKILDFLRLLISNHFKNKVVVVVVIVSIIIEFFKNMTFFNLVLHQKDSFYEQRKKKMG